MIYSADERKFMPWGSSSMPHVSIPKITAAAEAFSTWKIKIGPALRILR